jgi:hypothetical protein
VSINDIGDIFMLMCTASLTLHGAVNIVVRNLYSDIELTSPVYFCNCGTYREYSVEGTDVNAKIGFQFSLLDKLPGGILIYEVQRKGNTGTDHQPNTDTTSAKVVEDTSKMMRLLVTWRIERFGEPKVHIVLAEHDSGLVIEDKLVQLYDKIDDQFSRRNNTSKSTWLVCDNTVLETAYEIVQEEGLGLKIAISKGAKDKYTKSALWIDSERQVLFEIVIHSMLIYIISLTFQSIMDVTIKNECTNIELTSPICFTKGAKYHGHLTQQVDSKSKMKANFRTDMDSNAVGGVLLYHLQRKKNDESNDQSDTDEDTPISAQLLVIWKFRIDRLYPHVWLIEPEDEFTWSEGKLKGLYDVYDSQDDTDFIFNRRRWMLDDRAKSQIVCKVSHEGGFKMDITISEEGGPLPQKPLWIDPKR